MNKLKMESKDRTQENFEKLAALFPNAVTETIDENGVVVRAIDKDVLQQEISAVVVEGRDKRRLYLKNTYRVLLTRARQGMVIFVPEGSDTDPTRLREYYDGTYNYLRELGVREL